MSTYTTITWDEAERKCPGCSADWDAQKLTDLPVHLFVNAADGITACVTFDIPMQQSTRYWAWIPGLNHWKRS